MILGAIDFEVVRRVLVALSEGMRKVEAGSSDGSRKITGYYITDKQIRIDIVEVS